MGSLGAFRSAWFAIILACAMLASGPATGLLDEQAARTPAAPPQNDEAARADAPPLAPAIIDDLEKWLTWSQEVPLATLQHEAHKHVPDSIKMILPSPDTFAGHNGAPEDAKRESWRAWWLAAAVTAHRVPSIPHDPLATDGTTPAAQDQDKGGNESGEENTATTPIGEPHGLERLWRLQTHGAPHMLLPAGDGQQTFLVTQEGVLYLPTPGAAPDWMLQLDGVVNHAEVTGEGRKDLVVGMHNLFMDATADSIWVIDGEKEKVRFRGLNGDRALLHWTLTDVNGDGTDDILGIDRTANITALELDGTEIWRKGIPLGDAPEEEIEIPAPFFFYASLGMSRTGAQVFGDATGDGTKDVFVTSIWGLGGMLWESKNAVIASLMDGSAGEIVWSQTLNPVLESYGRYATPTLTGDLDGDGLADVAIFDWYESLFQSQVTNIYLSGTDGSVLAQDDPPMFCCPNDDPFSNLVFGHPPYYPLAFVDLDGDGTNQIIGIQTWWAWYYEGNDQLYMDHDPVLQLRSLPETPGGQTQVDQTHRFTEGYWWLDSTSLQANVHRDGDKDRFTMLVPWWAQLEEDGKGLLIVADEDGIHHQEPPQRIGHYTVNPQTGQGYAWTLNDDRWTPVNKAFKAKGNGTRLIMSNWPITIDDKDKDGTPDILIRRSMGYFWISGRNATIISSVDRPATTEYVTSSRSDGRYLLERDPDHFILFDVLKQESIWMINRDVAEDAGVWGLADYTGDGKQELLLRHWGEWSDRYEPEDDEWEVYAPSQPATVWSMSLTDASAQSGDFIKGRNGTEILFTIWDEDETELRMVAPGHDEESTAWKEDFDAAERITTGQGHIALLDYSGSVARMVMLEAATGDEKLTKELGDDEDPRWAQVVGGAGAHTRLVYSFTTGSVSADNVEQFISVVALDGETVTTFQVTDPLVFEESYSWFGTTYTYTWMQTAYPGPHVGDWNQDGHPDLAFWEQGWPVVRSLKDGNPLAIGPTRGLFSFGVDLNDDGRSEIALNAAGSLRMYTYDPDNERMEAEDPFARADAVDPDEGDNQTAEDFFRGKKERTPGPAAVLVLAMMGLLVGVIRRRQGNA